MGSVRHILKFMRRPPGRALLSFLLLCLPAGCTQRVQQAAAPAGVPIIRVRLLESQDTVKVASTQSMAFREAPGVSARPLNVPRKQEILVLRTRSGWRVGDTSV